MCLGTPLLIVVEVASALDTVPVVGHTAQAALDTGAADLPPGMSAEGADILVDRVCMARAGPALVAGNTVVVVAVVADSMVAVAVAVAGYSSWKPDQKAPCP